MALIVNGERIPDARIEAEMDRLDDEIPTELEDQHSEAALREYAKASLVMETLLLQEARKTIGEVSDEEVDTFLTATLDEFSDSDLDFDDEYLDVMWELARSSLQVSKLLDVVTEDVPVPTAEEVRAFYDRDPSLCERESRIRLARVVMSAEDEEEEEENQEIYERMVEVRRRLKAGADFATVADEYSEISDEEPGGDVGFVERDDLFPELRAVAFSLDVGEISPVLLTKFGYHVITVTEKRDAGIAPFEEVEKELAEKVYDIRKSEVVAAFVDALRDQAEIIDEDKSAHAHVADDE